MDAEDKAHHDSSGDSSRDSSGDSSEQSAEEAERAFVEGLIARGEAAVPDEDGRLPAGATHELVEDGDGRLRARRKRFSAF